MLTKYTASEIMTRIVNLNLLHHALRGDLDMTRADAEKIIKDAQEALQTYHNFLLIREGIPDNVMDIANSIGYSIFGAYVDTDTKGGSDNENHH